MNLTDLNIDCLVHIFSFCSEFELRKVCKTNWFLKQVIEEHIFFFKTIDLLMCGHRNRAIIQERTRTHLFHGDRLIVARNWLNGRFQKRCYLHHDCKFSTKLHLEKNHLYLSHAHKLRRYLRPRNYILKTPFERETFTENKSHIVDFVKNGDTIFSGRERGMCLIYENGRSSERRMHRGSEYVQCVDFANDLYVTSSDKCCKLWRRADEDGFVNFDLMRQLEKGYKSIKISQDCVWLYGGLYKDLERRSALRVVHIESGIETILNSLTTTIFDLKMKDEHVLFTANYDATFRMYDKRLGRDVSMWKYQNFSFSCLAYDGLNGVLCGVKHQSRVNLYDIRKPGHCVQHYFPNCEHHTKNTHVNSIACDSRHLFVATDHNVQIFDFKRRSIPQPDYSMNGSYWN